MINKFLLAVSVSLICTATVFTSCSKNDMDEIKTTQVANSQKSLIEPNAFTTPSLDELSKVFAKAMADQDFRTFIKSEALLQFDEDYDILYNNISSRSFKTSTINEYLIQQVMEIKGYSHSTATTHLQTLISNVPRFQISVPLWCEEWIPSTYVPLVTSVPAEYDDEIESNFIAYNSSLAPSTLSSKEEPEFPFVVLGISEWTCYKKPDKKLSCHSILV